jgi:hypothetical protein
VLLGRVSFDREKRNDLSSIDALSGEVEFVEATIDHTLVVQFIDRSTICHTIRVPHRYGPKPISVKKIVESICNGSPYLFGWQIGLIPQPNAHKTPLKGFMKLLRTELLFSHGE